MEILKKVTELKAELDALRPLDADREAAIMQKLRLDWNFHSNHLEGNSLNYVETKALFFFGISAPGKPLKDHFEITGHDEAIKWVEDVVKEERPLSENFIRELHKLILKEPYESPTITPEGVPGKRVIKVGEYKTRPNHVKTPTGEIFRFATPEETPAKMHDLIEWYREKEKDKETHPLLLAVEFHYKFIRIHPFDDGNGRMARILMNFILMKYDYPPVIILSEEKTSYINALRQADAGTVIPFIDYIGNNLAYSLNSIIQYLRGEEIIIVEDDFVEKEIAQLRQKLKILGKGIEKLMSRESILSVWSNSINALFIDFVEKCQKFNEFYEDTGYNYQVNGRGNGKKYTGTFDESFAIQEIKANGKETNRTRITYNFHKFSSKGTSYFDYSSSIYIFFEKNFYTVHDSNEKLHYKNPYHINLTKRDISKITNAEVKAHSEFIKLSVQQIKKF